jgi:hypothetical protein
MKSHHAIVCATIWGATGDTMTHWINGAFWIALAVAMMLIERSDARRESRHG